MSRHWYDLNSTTCADWFFFLQVIVQSKADSHWKRSVQSDISVDLRENIHIESNQKEFHKRVRIKSDFLLHHFFYFRFVSCSFFLLFWFFSVFPFLLKKSVLYCDVNVDSENYCCWQHTVGLLKRISLKNLLIRCFFGGEFTCFFHEKRSLLLCQQYNVFFVSSVLQQRNNQFKHQVCMLKSTDWRFSFPFSFIRQRWCPLGNTQLVCEVMNIERICWTKKKPLYVHSPHQLDWLICIK